MKFDNIIGNEPLKHYLKQMVEKKAVGNSLLFAGQEGIGKSLFAEALAEALLTQDDPTGQQAHKLISGNHPDLHVYRPEGKLGMHSIATLRQFNDDVYLAPFEAKWKIFIIHDAERMLPYSANAMLKTFEEPALNSVIILLSSQPEALIPTILSRCRTIRFQHLSEDEVAAITQKKLKIELEEAKHLAKLAHGSAGKAIRMAQQEGNQLRDQILATLVKGAFATYYEMTSEVAKIVSIVDNLKKQNEEELRSTVFKNAKDDLNASQREHVEKEVEGMVATLQKLTAQALFIDILGWFRDLQLLKINGHDSLLLHRDQKDQLEQTLQRGNVLPIESVEKVISEAELSLERSTSLDICLENLFLKLNFL